MKSNWLWIALRGIVMLVAGAYLMTESEAVSDLVLRLIGLFITASGVMSLLAAWPNRKIAQGKRAMFQSAIDLAIGLTIFLFPQLLSGFISVLLGIWLIISGGSFVIQAFRLRSTQPGRWLGRLVFGLALVIPGLIMIANPRLLFDSITFFIGLAMALYGLISLWSAFVLRRQEMIQ